MKLSLAAVIPEADVPPGAAEIRDRKLTRILRRIENCNSCIPELSWQQTERYLLGRQDPLRMKHVRYTRLELLRQSFGCCTVPRDGLAGIGGELAYICEIAERRRYPVGTTVTARATRDRERSYRCKE